MDIEDRTADTRRRMLIGFYTTEQAAERALRRLIDHDFPMDRVSLLGKAGASGDDPLGIYYPSTRERMRAWGRMGVLWGGLLGMLTGAAGLFVIPGLGPMLLVGPIAEIVAATVTGAGLGGGLMAGGAALSEIAVTSHRMGVPESSLQELEGRLRDNQLLLMLIVDQSETDEWRDILNTTLPDELWCFPYVGLSDVIEDHFTD